MNERIRELLLKAGWDRYEALDERNQKFALALLTEVMSTINNMDRYSGDRDVDDIAEALARHFGVK
jgi:hypothetical protein